MVVVPGTVSSGKDLRPAMCKAVEEQCRDHCVLFAVPVLRCLNVVATPGTVIDMQPHIEQSQPELANHFTVHWEFRVARSCSNIVLTMAFPVWLWPEMNFSDSRCQHQFSMIRRGGSTASQATPLIPKMPG